MSEGPINQEQLVQAMKEKEYEKGEVTDRISLPGMSLLFELCPTGKVEKPVSVQLKIAKGAENLPRAKFAKVLVEILEAYSGVTEVRWKAEEPAVHLKVAEAWHQRQIGVDLEKEDLEEIFTYILKLRSRVKGLTWRLGMPFLELTYVL